MVKDKSIFGLRFGSNEDLQPAPDELALFLQSPKKEGGHDLHSHDLTEYRKMLADIMAFENSQQLGPSHHNLRGKMFYGVLDHASFFTPTLASVVEQYKYHLHRFQTLDFRKPKSFISSVKEEMGRLNPKKRRDAERLARLQELVDSRAETLVVLEKARSAMSAELLNIAAYVRDNLRRISERCEAAIVILVQIQTEGKEKDRLIEEIKTRFKEELRNTRDQGLVTKQALDAAKEDVTILTKEMATLLREDVYALTSLYEAIHDHVDSTARKVDALITKIENNRNRRFEEEQERFTQIEQLLILLLSDVRFELKTVETLSETTHRSMLAEKRSEMIDHFFALLRRERRARNDRRTGIDRREFRDPGYQGPERRVRKDRRSEKNRRKSGLDT
jgi:hypothetical protein